ncbi:MAG: serine/threonine protein kinase [Myxococcales bacterium]|nr:serine/threonine protein kinase [Myxococcales bacterium]
MATCPTCRKQYPGDYKICPADGEALLPDEAFGNADGDLPAGATVGEYQVEGKIGEGGFGAVYRAVHPLIGKLVAIKVLNRQYSSNPQMVSRFIAEARSVNQIRHRNIIDIFAFGKLEDGRQYFVMELLDGQPLDRYLASKVRLPPGEAVSILGAVARALDAAHGCGVAHRDLKPENIFLEQDRDGYVFPKLLDFGIAKLLAESTGHVTRTGMPIGTPSYMSPEQCRAKNVDHRTDIYSFGILAYEMLTGRLPFDGDNIMELMMKQVNEQPKAPSEVCPALPKELDAPILHMLQKDPAARPATVVEAVEALASAAAAVGEAPAATPSRSGGAFRSGPITPGHLPQVTQPSPGSLGAHSALAEAKTMAQEPDVRTLQGAATDVGPAPGRGKWLVVGGLAAALVAGGVVAGVVLAGGSGPAADASTAAPAATAAPSARPSATATPTPSASAAAPSTSQTAAAVEAEVEIELASVPDGTSVLLAGEKIGSAPGIVKLRRGTDKVKLTLRAAGYRDLDVEVTPDKNRTFSPPPMSKVAGTPPPIKKADKKELEDPGL